MEFPAARPCYVALILIGSSLACEPERMGPTGSFPTPSFLLGGPIEETTCGPNVAWAASFSGHFDATKGVDSINPMFKDALGQPRTQCGDLPFENQVDSVRIRWAPSPHYHDSVTNIWQVKYRRTQGSDSMSVVFQQVVDGGTITDRTFAVKRRDNADAVSFRVFMNAQGEGASDPTSFDNACDNACIQHWRRITAPVLDALSVTGANNNMVQVAWTNWNWTRPIDSTEIYRNSVRVGATSGTTNGFLDVGPLGGGSYNYQLRHVAPPSPIDPELISTPNSAYSNERTAQITNPPPPSPPTGLLCEGNFAPTMDCRWQNTVLGVTTEVFRNGTSRATVATGLITWTDTAVTRGTSYEFKVRHVDAVSGPGSFGTPDTAVANPVPPENLSCGRTGATTASCAWVPKEFGPTDSVEVQRTITKPVYWETRAVFAPDAAYFGDTGLLSSKAYTYRARYRRGNDWSAWSNTDGVGTTWPEPYGPQGP